MAVVNHLPKALPWCCQLGGSPSVHAHTGVSESSRTVEYREASTIQKRRKKHTKGNRISIFHMVEQQSNWYVFLNNSAHRRNTFIKY